MSAFEEIIITFHAYLIIFRLAVVYTQSNPIMSSPIDPNEQYRQSEHLFITTAHASR